VLAGYPEVRTPIACGSTQQRLGPEDAEQQVLDVGVGHEHLGQRDGLRVCADHLVEG
jgi:hypothetical protein